MESIEAGKSIISVFFKYLSHNWLIIIVLASFFFLLGATVVYFFMKSKIYSLFDNDLRTYRNSISNKGLFSFLSIVGVLRQRKNVYKKKVLRLNRRIVKLNIKLRTKTNSSPRIINDSVENKNSKEIEENSIKTIEWEISPDKTRKLSSFFSIPESDGRFKKEMGDQNNDGSKFYRIDYLEKSDEGELFYVNGTQDRRAINRLDSYLKPVCDIENLTNAENATAIQVMQPGLVIRFDDSWVIDTNHKVKIKLV